MSDIDRLREAADICLQPYAFSGFKEPDPFAVALAALLRAVADEFHHYNVSVSGIKAAARALADTILGAE